MKFDLMRDIQTSVPVFVEISGKVAGVQDIQQQLHRHICGEIADFRVQPLPGCYIENVIRVGTDGVFSQPGQKNDGNALFVKKLRFILNTDGGTGVGDDDGAVFRGGGKGGAELFGVVGFQEHEFSEALHIPFKESQIICDHCMPCGIPRGIRVFWKGDEACASVYTDRVSGFSCRNDTGSHRFWRGYSSDAVLSILFFYGAVDVYVPVFVCRSLCFHRLALPAFCVRPPVCPAAAFLFSGLFYFPAGGHGAEYGRSQTGTGNFSHDPCGIFYRGRREDSDDRRGKVCVSLRGPGRNH